MEHPFQKCHILSQVSHFPKTRSDYPDSAKLRSARRGDKRQNMEQTPLTEIIETPEATDYPALGKVISSKDGQVIFNPSGTRYQMHLATTGPYAGPINKPIQARLTVKARKVYTVPRGG